jgi:malonyl-[acp] decarboxylase
VGGASASGNVALYHAWQWIRTGLLDACVVVGASADFSEVELQGFAILGAACGEPSGLQPREACRPFDRDRTGFVLGEGSGCVVLENLGVARRRGVRVLGEVRGGSLVLDGNSLANPALDGEIKAMRVALREAGVAAAEIGYLNAHGSASVLGDQVECEAVAAVFRDHLANLPVNSTKSLTGHCMFAAGIIEFIACVIQLNEGFLHPNLNLVNPLDARLSFAGPRARPLQARLALSNGFGFGGFNSSLVLTGSG